MRVPERELQGPGRGAECIVDIKDSPARLASPSYRTDRGEPRRAPPPSALLGALSRRLMVDCETSAALLSGQRPTAIFFIGSCGRWLLVPAVNRQNTRHHNLEHCMPECGPDCGDPALLREPQANAIFALRLPQMQHTAIWTTGSRRQNRRCAFLVSDRWQIESKRRIVSHSGGGAG
jgi:hypothetical protein